MTMEVHNPQIECVVKQAFLSGRYGKAEDVVPTALSAWSNQQVVALEQAKPFEERHTGKGTLLEVCANGARPGRRCG